MNSDRRWLEFNHQIENLDEILKEMTEQGESRDWTWFNTLCELRAFLKNEMVAY